MVIEFRLVPTLFLVVLFIIGTNAQQSTEPVQIDEFGQISNDGLMSRLENLYVELSKQKDSSAVAVLSGNSWERQTNLRRIMGCHEWLKLRTDRISYRFTDVPEMKVEFWLIPNGTSLSISGTRPVDYDLSDLHKAVEFSASQSTDEYCPRYFDLNLYSRYLKANPSFRGRVMIDTSQRQFVGRVSTYRKQLSNLGIALSRIRFYRRHFYHERDEQWWLIPAKLK